MKKILLASAAAMALVSPALAADMRAPVMKAPIAPPISSWSGCYIGAQGGYAWGTTGYDLNIPATLNSGFDFDVNGGVAGGHLGCNMQFNQWVLGIEGDIEWNGIRGDDGGRGGSIDKISGNWGASLRGRLGFAMGPTLFYATGGVAWLDVDYSRPDFDSQVISKTLTGWTVGGGIEHAFAGNWTARVEYRFARFDSEGFAFTTGTQRTSRDLEANAVRVGLSYKFGGMYGGPY
jgi:outer membrane immunogenic protein